MTETTQQSGEQNVKEGPPTVHLRDIRHVDRPTQAVAASLLLSAGLFGSFLGTADYAWVAINGAVLLASLVIVDRELQEVSA